MKIKRGVLVRLWAVLNQLEGKHSVKFSYFVAKNRVAIKPEIETLEAVTKPSEVYVRFEEQRVELAKEHADRDENGEPIIKDNQYVITEKADEFEKKIQELKKKFKKAIDDRKKQIEEYEKLLDEEVNVDLYPIELTMVPATIEPAYLETFIDAGILKEE